MAKKGKKGKCLTPGRTSQAAKPPVRVRLKPISSEHLSSDRLSSERLMSQNLRGVGPPSPKGERVTRSKFKTCPYIPNTDNKAMSDTYTNHIRATGTPKALTTFAAAAKDGENLLSFQKLVPVSPKSGENHLENVVKKWGSKSQVEADQDLCEVKLHYSVETNGNTAEGHTESRLCRHPKQNKPQEAPNL